MGALPCLSTTRSTTGKNPFTALLTALATLLGLAVLAAGAPAPAYAQSQSQSQSPSTLATGLHISDGRLLESNGNERLWALLTCARDPADVSFGRRRELGPAIVEALNGLHEAARADLAIGKGWLSTRRPVFPAVPRGSPQDLASAAPW
ncbi:hypothetical protein [Streptomyces sp. SD15]